MIFWIGTVVVTAGAVALLWPAFRSHAGHAPAVHEARLAVYRDRRRELEAERTSGSIDEARYADALRELEDAAAGDLARSPDSVQRGGGRVAFVAAAVFVPVAAYGLYALLGAHAAVQQATVEIAQQEVPHDMRELVDRLDARMQRTPDDLDGWMMLGRSRIRLGEYGAAVAAWRQAHRLAPDDSTVLANLGEALILDDAAALGGEGGVLIEEALEQDPHNPKALWYGGLHAELRGDVASAEARWRRLLALDPPPELVPVIERRLDALGTGPG